MFEARDPEEEIAFGGCLSIEHSLWFGVSYLLSVGNELRRHKGTWPDNPAGDFFF